MIVIPAKQGRPQHAPALLGNGTHTQVPAGAQTAIRRDRRAGICQHDLRFIRLKEVLAICGKSRSSVYEAIKKGKFPAPVKLCGRSSAWIRSEVIQWAEACIQASRQ